VILVLTNADTELLALRIAAEGLPEGFPAVRAANPSRLSAPPDLDGVEVVLVRLLGGRLAWEAGFDDLRQRCRQRGVPLVACGGEAVPDAELAERSTVASGIVTDAFAYWAHGGVDNMANLLRFVADTVMMTGFGFDPPVPVPTTVVVRDDRPADAAGSAASEPVVGVVFYRAHLLAGNVAFVEALCDAVAEAGGHAVAVATYSLRADGDDRVAAAEVLGDVGVDVVVTTTLAAGRQDDEAASWDAGALGRLGVCVVQAVCATSTGEEWERSSMGLAPTDVAMAVAVPELDGRIVTVPLSFKEVVDDDDLLGTPLTAYRTRPDRVRRVAEVAVRLGRLRRLPPSERRVALVLSAYPTKRSRLGNAVGLDTPASVVTVLRALAAAGYRVDRIPADGDRLMAELADGLTYDLPAPTPTQVARAVGTVDAERYARWFAALDPTLADAMATAWGPPPGKVGLASGPGGHGALVFAGLDLGNVLVAIQPPRGFGEDPIAVYHSPDLPPTHHYLAFYRWLDEVWGAHAIVHVGKHGTLEWLPGKGVGLSAGCAPDAVLGSVPFVYPFVVNDPGEGTQAKRRGHAVIVDHLVPPLTRADTYDDLARLEGLLDEHARVASLDPSKLPAIRRQVWDCLVDAEIHRDLGLVGAEPGGGPAFDDPAFDDPAFDDLLPEVDGYLCELKDAQIRGGLHVLGQAPSGAALVDLLLALTRLPQGRRPSLRQAVAARLGVDLEAGRRVQVDQVEDACRALLERCAASGWVPPEPSIIAAVLRPPVGDRQADVARADVAGSDATGSDAAPADAPEADAAGSDAAADAAGSDAARPDAAQSGADRADVAGSDATGSDAAADAAGSDAARPDAALADVGEVLQWVATDLVPRLQATTGEVDAVLGALGGRFVPPGPSGAPSRGHSHVLPTGRNFYGVDPRAVPSMLAWDVGRMLADRLVERHVAEEGHPPRHVALVVWGTAAMRTGGDDIAEALALLGVRPRWSATSGRVEGIEVLSVAELGRPRVDVTVRVSGFFRDAFPHVLALFDEATTVVAALDEDPTDNPLVGRADERRLFGPKPGAYGSGILPLLESRQWRGDQDLADVYVAWGGWSYHRGAMGAPAADALRRRLATVDVAVKNQDNREHDIFDSDDYLQDHGGMVAAIRALTGRQPKAWFGDTADPARPRVRSLAEEAARVVRTRVINPKWVRAMMRHGYKGAFEMAATVDYLFGYDATAQVVEDWMYERVTDAYVADPEVRAFLARSNPWALRSIAERLLEAVDRGLWEASDAAVTVLRAAVLEGEGWEEGR
jgi:cobaltochelatase CobN